MGLSQEPRRSSLWGWHWPGNANMISGTNHDSGSLSTDFRGPGSSSGHSPSGALLLQLSSQAWQHLSVQPPPFVSGNTLAARKGACTLAYMLGECGGEGGSWASGIPGTAVQEPVELLLYSHHDRKPIHKNTREGQMEHLN